tara:strand:+ start:563 stop:1084 length:522 start_codon:yes stop_codon:yes gene_type:complete
LKKLKLIYGSDTGKTEYIVKTYLSKVLEEFFLLEIVDIVNISENDWKSHDNYILGCPTWWDGDLQSDWEDYFDTFKEISFKEKKVALFGLGDQVGYEDWFCDGLGILGEIIVKNDGEVLGFTIKDKSYEFICDTKAVKNDNLLWGLALDDDNQSNLSEDRIKNWVNQLVLEFK